jgi:signal transduction histidine kinase
VPIVGYSDIRLSEKIGPLNEDQKKRLRVVKDCTVRLQMLINDIFDVQKIELGRLRLNKADHRLSDIIKETIEEFMPTFEIEQIKIRTILDENILCSCDKKRVQQVLSNLIKNSIDFCPDNEGQILIRLYVEDNNAKIIVTDNGKGIMKEDISNLFGKFYQINTNTTREHGGTGLGLCICKGIIENHGGRIWIESEGIGKGVQVSMILPQITADKTSWMDEDLETDFIMGHNYLQDTQEAAMQALL